MKCEHPFVHDAHLKAKARKLRIEKKLTIDELAERLALSRTTIFYWVRDLPLKKKRRYNPTVGAMAMNEKHRLLREAAYEQGCEEFDRLDREPTFRDFVCMYIGEGYKRNRNTVAICNSDPSVVKLGHSWIQRLARNKVTFAVQYHADQDLDELRDFWSRELGVSPGEIVLQRKSNSGQLKGRTWRSRWGVLTVRSCDTLLRARLQAWMDRVRDSWVQLSESGA